MAASTISNSGGPGSPTELSPVTIAVRDKVIEKFQDQPLKEMNESLKMLLSNEQDEQKRLGILAARVYIAPADRHARRTRSRARCLGGVAETP